MAFRPTVGLDIGMSQIKAVEVRPGKGRLTITALGVAPTPIGVMQNNLITDPQLMGQAVRQLLRESGITTKRIVGSVAGQSAVVIRIIEVPRMTDAELKETMKWEVERHVPFAPSETVIDYQPLTVPGGTGDANPNMEVLLAVAQQDVVNNLVDTVFAAGLDPVAIDIEPLASARALLDLSDGRPIVRPPIPAEGFGNVEGYAGPQETVAVVNIGAANTEICIYQDGELTFARPPLPLAGESLTRVIAETLGYSNLEQAERIKRDYAAVQLDRMAIYTGTAYGGQAGFDTPQFQDDDQGFTPRRSPSSLRRAGEPQFDEGFNAPLDNPFDFNTGAPAFDDMDRTQPIEKRTLNLAARSATPGGFLSGSAEGGLGMPPGMGAPDDAAIRDQVFEAIAPVLGELATELRRSLDYYRSRAQARSVDRVLLAGGSATLVNLAPFLQNELQVPVAVADPLGGLEVAAKHYDPNYLQSIAPVFTVAVGLATRDAVFEANPVAKKPKPAKAAAAPQNAPTS